MTDSALSPTDLATLTPGPIQLREPAPLVISANPYERMVFMAFEKGELSALDKLLELQLKWEANEARKAFVADLAELKKQIPIEIFKRKRADIPGGAKYQYADLAEVCDAAIGPMGQFGFTHRWKLEQEDGAIKVTCILTHARGHSEDAYMYGAPDDTGKKSAIQQSISTVSYLERVTLLAVMGLAAKGMDNDGAKVETKPATPDGFDVKGYEKWRADMQALADEGLARLTKTWSESNADFRRQVIRVDEKWWDETKAKAVKADKKAKESNK